MGASTQISSPAGKAGSSSATSGQPKMGQPNVASPYRRTIGGWDQAQIGSPTPAGKSGKGSSIQPFQPRPFQYTSPTAPQQAVNTVAPAWGGGQDVNQTFGNPGISNGIDKAIANGPLGLAIGAMANAFGGTQAPASVSDLSFTPVGFAPSIDIGGDQGGYGMGLGGDYDK